MAARAAAPAEAQADPGLVAAVPPSEPGLSARAAGGQEEEAPAQARAALPAADGGNSAPAAAPAPARGTPAAADAAEVAEESPAAAQGRGDWVVARRPEAPPAEVSAPARPAEQEREEAAPAAPPTRAAGVAPSPFPAPSTPQAAEDPAAEPPAGPLGLPTIDVPAAPLPAEPEEAKAPAAGAEQASAGRSGEVCTLVVDVRGLGDFQRDQFSYVYGPGGERLWPTAQQAANVDSQLASEGLLTYFRSEAEIAAATGPYKVVRAAALARNPDATARAIFSSAQLDASGAAQFQALNNNCRLAYLY